MEDTKEEVGEKEKETDEKEHFEDASDEYQSMLMGSLWHF